MMMIMMLPKPTTPYQMAELSPRTSTSTTATSPVLFLSFRQDHSPFVT